MRSQNSFLKLFLCRSVLKCFLTGGKKTYGLDLAPLLVRTRPMSRGEYFNRDHYCVEVVSSNTGQSSKYCCLVDEYLLSSSFKGIVWEIYECVSEVLSHLRRMFGIIFRVQWGQKSPKSGKMCLTKMYPGPCMGAAPDMPLLPAKNNTKHPPQM